LDNLKIYKMAEELELKVHEITKSFPSDEKYRSVDQLRRSSSSSTNNIAEGYNRHSIQEKLRYLEVAKGEAEETKRNILKSAKKGFLKDEIAESIADRYTELLKATNGYMRFLKSQKYKKMVK